MQNAIRTEIKRLSARAFERERRILETEQKYRKQYEKRTGLIAGVSTRAPAIKHKHFDPKYCARNANFLAKTIWFKVINQLYEPMPAIEYSIPKDDGGKRIIMAFSIPDAALANVVLRRSRGRNIKRLSPSSYAYHPDKNVFDAILALQEYEADGKLFAVQIDFEKYFDNIPNWYLTEKIDGGDKISLTVHEKYVYKKFLRHEYASLKQYRRGKFRRRWDGTPQGSSLSLLLANLANHDLDTTLSAAPGRFVRFADDVVALCSNYVQAQEIERCFYDHCKLSGLKLNQKKSLGIAIISNSLEEMRAYDGFDYLGYRFSAKGLSIPEKVENRIKSKIAKLINIGAILL
jgi:RNA-directed DNA polymerase